MSELFTLFGSGAPVGGAIDVPVDVPAEVSTLLASPDRKARMAAYAYIYANPDPRRIVELVDAVVEEGSRFGQYWGVRTLRRLVQADRAALDSTIRCRLEHLAATLEPDTDGAAELRQLLRESPD